MSGINCDDSCTVYYVATSVLVAVLSAAVSFCYLKIQKSCGTKQNSSSTQEMVPVSEGTQEESLVYSKVVFSDENRKSREMKSEETTYAEIKKTSQQDEGLVYSEVNHNAKSKAKKTPQNMAPETTYAEIKGVSRNSEPRDGSSDLYASVNKNRPANAKKD